MTETVADPRQTLPVASAGLEQYVNLAHEYPVLSAEEEHVLALRLRDEGDVEAARELVMHNLRFVIHVARGYTGYNLPLADLVQEGSIGLMKAVRRFDPTVGVRLVAFAVHWIRAEIHEYILRNWRIVKTGTTKAQRKLFFNLRRAKKRLGWLNDAEVKGIANELGVSPGEVREMEQRLSQPDLSVDIQSDDEDAPVSPLAYLPAPDADPAPMLESRDLQQMREESLHAAIAELDARSRAIVKERWFADPKRSLRDLAEEFGVSSERVRQIEAAALKKLHAALA